MVCYLGTTTLTSTVRGVRSPRVPITDPRRYSQSDPNHDSWRSEAPRVCYLATATLTSIVGGIEAVRGGENQATVAQKRSQKSRPVTVKKDPEVKGSHPRLSDLAWSSESFETARTREQLENPASAVGDTWTVGEKPLQHLYIKNVWKLANLWRVFKSLVDRQTQDVLLGIFWTLDKVSFERFVVILWSIWFERNRVLHWQNCRDPSLVLKSATQTFFNYQRVGRVDELRKLLPPQDLGSFQV
ncbi:hypothetical protein PanWU01x14_217750 [Parasponia andersonii]|uniref:Uncharacterized protein n=1 Tax=Parasponia andersonii TaxID=3476 RepID=A0A2P5BR47_PARAD|nr:hypothetical protein PanWU01x14_217750 [Parasponia andersonii]